MICVPVYQNRTLRGHFQKKLALARKARRPLQTRRNRYPRGGPVARVRCARTVGVGGQRQPVRCWTMDSRACVVRDVTAGVVKAVRIAAWPTSGDPVTRATCSALDARAVYVLQSRSSNRRSR